MTEERDIQVSFKARTVKTHTQSASVSIVKPDVWINVFETLYKHSGNDRGINGHQFKEDCIDEGGEILGSISITVYKTTNKMHIQGSSYLIWLLEVYPDLFNTVNAAILESTTINSRSGTTRSAAQ